MRTSTAQPADKAVFPSKESISIGCCILSALLFLLFPRKAISITSGATQYAIHHFGQGFIIVSSVMVILSLAIALSPYGKIRLGKATEQPEFGLFSWLAMLFAAGMGSGLIFWGVAEPLYHFANPPAFAQHAQSPKDMALALTYFHWGIHAWSIYAIAGLVMAWFAFNKGRSMSISASFTSNKQLNIYQISDFLAVIAVIFGVAGTLANTIALIQTGLQESISSVIGGASFRFTLLLVIATAFTASSVLGLNRGIKRLSQFNLYFVIALLAAVIWWANPLTVLEKIFSSTGVYLAELPKLSFTIDDNSRQWSEGWSVIYLVWWIAWAPFVGPFIARISRGRTIRQFLLCAVLMPTMTTILWFSAFAGGLFENAALTEVISAVNQDYTKGLFSFFSHFPFGQLLSVAAILLLATFVITSADSAIFVTGMLTGNDKFKSKLVWSLILVTITMTLIYKNNVDLNKQIAIFGAIPFTLVLIMQAGIMVKELYQHKANT